MLTGMRSLTFLFAALVMAQPASAQSSLGLAGIEATMGLTASSGTSFATGRLSGDFRITEAHGFQLDLSARDYPGGYLGQIDGHLYLAPSTRSKYGLFASLADVSGREATIAYAGAEGIFALGSDTILQARAGIGYARPGAFDFVAADAQLAHALSDTIAVHVGAQIAEVQEQALDTRPWAAELGLDWHIADGPLFLSAALGATGLAGPDSAPSDTYLRLGLTWRYGGAGGARRPISARPFTAPAPFDPLFRRGLF